MKAELSAPRDFSEATKMSPPWSQGLGTKPVLSARPLEAPPQHPGQASSGLWVSPK